MRMTFANNATKRHAGSEEIDAVGTNIVFAQKPCFAEGEMSVEIQKLACHVDVRRKSTSLAQKLKPAYTTDYGGNEV